MEFWGGSDSVERFRVFVYMVFILLGLWGYGFCFFFFDGMGIIGWVGLVLGLCFLLNGFYRMVFWRKDLFLGYCGSFEVGD